jgi:replicative DNA helicase
MSAQPKPVVELARVPPQNLEAEESVLGAMLISPNAIDAVSDEVEPADFYRASHGMIFKVACDLHGKGVPVDAITLGDEIEERGLLEEIGGKLKLHELAAIVPASSNARHYARIVREMAVLRGLIRVGGEISRLGWDRPGEADTLVDQAQQFAFDLSQQRNTQLFKDGEQIAHEGLARVMTLYESGSELTGVSSGLPDLDKITHGFQPGNLIIVAARPSMGKSALALKVVTNLALHMQVPVALFTLEMSSAEITERIFAGEGRIELERIRSGKLKPEEWPKLTKLAEQISSAPLFLDDFGSPSALSFRSKIRRLKAKRPDLGLVVVDYLQIATSGAETENRNQEVGQIAWQLKQLARDMQVPVLALSQLNRGVENRNDKRPQLSDLRDSGAIEEHADLVAFLYRDEYYHPDSEAQGIAELIIAKHRNGPTGTIKVAFSKRHASFSSLSRE